MFWLCSVSRALFDYRLIAINALIYDLIATEIVNVNAHIVVAATVMIKFDKSAAQATTIPETIAPTGAVQLAIAPEMSIRSNATTIKTTKTNTISSNDTADVAFFGQKLSDCSDDDEISINNNNQLTQTTNGASNNTAPQAAAPASANVTFVSIAAARPLAMRAHNCAHANNNATVMPTINERVDNYRNDKNETNVHTTTAAAAVGEVEQNVAASTVAVAARIRRTKTTTPATSNVAALAISKRPAIKAKVITAIKSTAMHLTTSALATASVMTAKTTETATAANAQAAESAIDNTAIVEAFETRSKWATALATTTATLIHATPAWSTLRSHDLLSSTNGMPNCRNATSVCVPTAKSHVATNMNAATTATTTTTPLKQTTRIPTTAAMKTATTLLSTSTAVASTTLQTTEVAADVRRATTTTATTDAASVAYAAGSTDSTTRRVAATPMRSQTPCPTYSSPATPAASSALQTQWQRILSRRKRYLAFSEGTSFTTSVCITIGIIGNPNANYMSFGLNFGMGYDLPNATWVLNQLHGLSRRPMPMAMHHRRRKRAIYERIAEAVNNMGYSGRDCVLRALCESRQYFTRTKMGMVGEILRVIFSLPKQRIFSRELHENSDIAVYDHAYRKARSQDCSAQYGCPFSLLELAFGRYSKLSDNFYGESGM
nr:mucin-5B-like [Bactrocera oleae]XP_036228870.1 mucin-5B-like [Bactrocera oleae]